MPLYCREGSPHWWVRFSVAGRKVRKSTGTADRALAEAFERREYERVFRLRKLGERGAHTFGEASARWLTETRKRSLAKDEAILAWFDEHLRNEPLDEIDRDAIDELRGLLADEGRALATVDRYMALLRAILRKAHREWRWLDALPAVPMHRPELSEPRFLTREEFARLRAELPSHLQLAADVAVRTGLRMRSMLALTWDRVDLKARRAWVPGAQMKAGRSHGIPLSREVCRILKRARGENPHVFTFEGAAIGDCNTAAFKKAVKRAEVEPLRWHDLRHTWASWAVQSGVTLQELMELGGWKSYSMVLRYAHLAPDHLAAAAEKVRARVQTGHSGKRAKRVSAGKHGGKGGTRTLDPGIMSAARLRKSAA